MRFNIFVSKRSNIYTLRSNIIKYQRVLLAEVPVFSVLRSSNLSKMDMLLNFSSSEEDSDLDVDIARFLDQNPIDNLFCKSMELQEIKSSRGSSPTFTLALPDLLLVTSDSPVKKSSRPFKCFSCSDAVFATHSSLKRHEKHLHPKARDNICIVCQKRFRCKSELAAHTNAKHGEDPLHCEDCGKRYTTKEGLRYHRETIHGKITGTKNKCEFKECLFFYKNKQHYASHLANTHKKKLQCLKCLQQFVHPAVFKKHKCAMIPIPSNQVICTYENCDCTFKEKRYMLAHIKAVHLNKKVICEICGETFKHRSGLFRHKQKGHEQT